MQCFIIDPHTKVIEVAKLPEEGNPRLVRIGKLLEGKGHIMDIIHFKEFTPAPIFCPMYLTNAAPGTPFFRINGTGTADHIKFGKSVLLNLPPHGVQMDNDMFLANLNRLITYVD